jgi:hypothetical protein
MDRLWNQKVAESGSLPFGRMAASYISWPVASKARSNNVFATLLIVMFCESQG